MLRVLTLDFRQGGAPDADNGGFIFDGQDGEQRPLNPIARPSTWDREDLPKTAALLLEKEPSYYKRVRQIRAPR
jgi:hypothetical protein